MSVTECEVRCANERGKVKQASQRDRSVWSAAFIAAARAMSVWQELFTM